MGMRWEDEGYVKLYVRDTPTWRSMPWQSRALLPLLLRKVDKAGLLECGDLGRGVVSLMVDMPEDVTTEGLTGLEKLGVVAWHNNTLEVLNFEAAQEARKTELARKRDQRQRDKDKARAEALKTTQLVSHGVTRGHAASHAVTLQTAQTQQTQQREDGNRVTTPSLFVAPIPTQPNSPVRQLSENESTRKRNELKPPVQGKTPLEGGGQEVSLRDRMEAAWLKAIGTAYAWGFEDDQAMRPLLQRGNEREILERWRRAIVWKGFPTCASVKDLVRHWNHYAKEQPKPAEPDRVRL